MHILISEDNPDELAYLSRIVVRMGHTCDSCSDGDTCLEKLRTDSYDLIIIDVFLPGKDGWELLEALGNMPIPRPRAVVISGLDDENAIGQILRGGAAVFLSKPITPDTLKSVINRLDPSRTTAP